jgi:hypothetical protein
MTLSYTGGPFPLFAYLGLGEVFVLIFLDGSLLALATLSRRCFSNQQLSWVKWWDFRRVFDYDYNLRDYRDLQEEKLLSFFGEGLGTGTVNL